MIKRFPLPAPEDPELRPRQLLLEFVPTRSRVTRLRLDGDWDLGPLEGHARLVPLPGDRDIRRLVLEVHSEGKPVSLRPPIYAPKRAQVQAAFADPFVVRQQQIDEWKDELELLDDKTTATAVELAARIRAAEYFLALDQATLGSKDAALQAQMGSMIELLRRRLHERWLAHGAKRPPAPEPGASLFAVTTQLSQLQIGLLTAHFTAGGGLDVAAVRDAHRRFALGTLGPCNKPSARPDSGFVFLFSEFASLAIEHQLDELAWRAVLPCLVELLDIYRRTCGSVFPACTPLMSTAVTPDFSDYGPALSGVAVVQATLAAIGNTIDTLAGQGVDALMAHQAYIAYALFAGGIVAP